MTINQYMLNEWENLLISYEWEILHIYKHANRLNICMCLDNKLSKYNEDLKIEGLYEIEVCFFPVARRWLCSIWSFRKSLLCVRLHLQSSIQGFYFWSKGDTPIVPISQPKKSIKRISSSGLFNLMCGKLQKSLPFTFHSSSPSPLPHLSTSEAEKCSLQP